MLKTFPHIEDQLRFVYFGTENYNIEGVEIYGNPDREGGAHETGSLGPMPAWGELAGGDLTDEEILAVVCHERYTLGGADPTSDEYVEEFEDWCAEEAPAFVALEDGSTLDELNDLGTHQRRGRTDHDHRHRRRSARRVGPLMTAIAIEPGRDHARRRTASRPRC